MVAIVIAVSQGKGGVAKTTTSVNLAGALNEMGFSTFLYDWDAGKPDALKWKGNGEFINWIALISKDNPIKDIEDAKLKNSFLIFDTPPNYEQNSFKAIMASDFVIIPTSVNYLDQENAKDAISVPMLAKKPFKILMSKVKKGTREGKELQDHVSKQDISFKSIITDRNVIAQCPKNSQWIGQFAKGSDSHYQFLMLAKEVLSWVGVTQKMKMSEAIL